MKYFISTTYPTKAQLDRAVDDFAELLATDLYSFVDIARIMGTSAATPCVLMRMLCERVGERV